MNSSALFLDKLAQTTSSPYLIEIERAEGSYVYDSNGKKYLDMIAGVSVNNIGHRHPKVIEAIKSQLDKYLHVMVYGEFIQHPQNQLASKLTSLLPPDLNCVYPVNSGTEANEAALKLIKRATGRTEIVSFRGSYHGSTHGSLSVSGNEVKKQPFRPLLPDVRFLAFNSIQDLDQITSKTAGVIIEPVQGDAGVRIANKDFLAALKKRCIEVGALLIFDEIQCGLGRVGQNFAFEIHGIQPDILTLGKALGGGMPIGALVCSKELMANFKADPMLGHITTFGGHPVVCSAANAFLEVLSSEIDYLEVERKGAHLESMLIQNDEIIEIRRHGLMYAIDMVSFERVSKVVNYCLSKGLISFWFLSHPDSFRLSPPLNISESEIILAGNIIIEAIEATK
jgi:acetylornithine/N-succinyldiaminopimelate aminotransferase